MLSKPPQPTLPKKSPPTARYVGRCTVRRRPKEPSMKRLAHLNEVICGAVVAGALCASPALAQEPVLQDAIESPVSEFATATDVETIRERHANRTVKIEREVIRDADDNYVNHGAWKMWDKDGELVAEGNYRDGRRQGEWTSWFHANESKLFGEEPFKHFEGPFVSKTTFDEGLMDGTWTIHDNQDRKICEWHYVRGQRHGSWSTWFPNGQLMTRVEYNEGELDGESTTWDSTGQIVRKGVFQAGRQLIDRAEYFSKDEKKSEGVYLLAKQQLDGEDDWWNARLASFKTVGKDERHGIYKEWYRNGQLRGEGVYEHGEPNGHFTWWYENGQRSVEGHFEDGSKLGRWTWWHANGQKSIDGEFEGGSPHGKWIWWNDSGKVAQRVEYSAGRIPGQEDLLDAAGQVESIVKDATAPPIQEEAEAVPSKSVPKIATEPANGIRIR
ncbi:MAG: toxin-antitoxin system YwqK family antitoxin [Planctomycetota bacterium]|nr:MAG: toxin-antitoxin system YwqK family antitoxin [Planctomycetota bacterium]